MPALFDLPGPEPDSLALRKLKRARALQLPSGQDVARFLRVTQVLTGAGLDAPEPTPLWFYRLKESELAVGGQRLGPVGGRVVAEVLLGLLHADTQSYINQDPDWTPMIPGGHSDRPFALGDLLLFAAT